MFVQNALIIFPSFYRYAFGHSWKEYSSIYPPLGSLYLASQLKKDGYNVEFIDFNIDRLERDDFERIVKRQEFILISCYTRCLETIDAMISDIRHINPCAIILCGGPHCNISKAFIVGSDITVIGDAEQQISEILRRAASKDLSGIPGVLYANNGNVVRNEGIMVVDDLDKSEFPSHEFRNKANYGYLYGVNLNHYASIMTSRGCPFDCSFCTSKGLRYRKRSIDNVMEEIHLLTKQGIRYFGFCDDNFITDRKRTLELMARIIRDRLKIKVLIQARVDAADLELYKTLKLAGVIVVMYGIESVDPRVLEYYDKRITAEDIDRALSLANRVGFIIVGQFIIGAPMETLAHFRLYKLKYRRLPIDVISLGILTYYYESKIWKEAAQKGLIGAERHHIEANSDTAIASHKELLEIQKDIMKSFYSSKRRLLRILIKCVKNLDAYFLLTILKIIWRNDYRRKISEIMFQKLY